MKKSICLCVALTCILAMSGCNPAPTPGSNDKSKPITKVLTDKGLELIREVDRLAECPTYTSLYSSGEEIADAIKDIAEKDYTKPKAVFVIADLDSLALQRLSPQSKWPADIEELMKGRLASALPSQINAMNGAVTIAATSILNHEDSFICEGLESVTTYLYTYDNGYGFMVTFVPDDENIVNADVTVVCNDALSKCATAEEVAHFFKESLDLQEISVSAAPETTEA